MKNLVFVDLKIEMRMIGEQRLYETTLIPTKEDVTPEMVIEAEAEGRLVSHGTPELWHDIAAYHGNTFNPCYIFDHESDSIDKYYSIVRGPKNGGKQITSFRAKVGEEVPGVEKVEYLRGAVEHYPVYDEEKCCIDSVIPNSTHIIKFY